MKVRDLVKYGEEVLKSAGIDTYKSDVKILVTHALDIEYSKYFLCLENEVTMEQNDRFVQIIKKRAQFYPCQYITNSQDFMGITFYVEEGVLIPRPETELLVDEAIKQSSGYGQRVLDMCCGSGCIGISYKLLRRNKGFDDIVDLADISDTAIRVSGRNNNALNAGCNIIKTDLFGEIDKKYNIIISNPPYIMTEEIDKLMEDVKCYEPKLALDGDLDGLYFYKRIISDAKKHLEANGLVLFEIGYNQYAQVRMLFENEGYTDIKLIKDYAGLDRIVLARYS